MRNSISTACLLGLFAFLGAPLAKGPEFNLNAMDPPKLQLEYPAKALSVGDTLQLKVALDSGWHINANEVTDEFLVPSRLEVKATGIQFAPAVWPKPIKAFNEALQMESLLFSGTFVVKIPVSGLAPSFDSLSTHATLYYQSCSDAICLAPTQASVSLTEGLGTQSKKKRL